MKTVHEVVVRETLERRVAVAAESKEEAIAKVKRDYGNYDLVLEHWSNFKDVEFITEE